MNTLTDYETQQLMNLGYKTICQAVVGTTQRTISIQNCYDTFILDDFERFFVDLGNTDERYEKARLAKELVTPEQINKWILKASNEPNFDINIKLPNGYECFRPIPNNINCKTLTVKLVDTNGYVEESFKITLK